MTTVYASTTDLGGKIRELYTCVPTEFTKLLHSA